VAYVLQENGYHTVGDLIMQMKIEQDEVLKLQGVGPRAMQEIQRLVEMYTAAAPAEEAPEAVAEAAPAEEERPGGFESVIAAPVDEIVQAAEQEPAVAEDVTIAPESPVQEADAAVAGAVTETAEGEEVTFDQLFTLQPDVVVADEESSEDEEGTTIDPKTGKKKKTKKGRKSVEVEYDPDADRTIARKKHKRGGEDWEW
jgi:N utilization substance protein A